MYPLRVSFYCKKITQGHFSASNYHSREKTGAIFKTTFFLAGKSYFYRDLRLLDRLQIECGLCNLSLGVRWKSPQPLMSQCYVQCKGITFNRYFSRSFFFIVLLSQSRSLFNGYEGLVHSYPDLFLKRSCFFPLFEKVAYLNRFRPFTRKSQNNGNTIACRACAVWRMKSLYSKSFVFVRPHETISRRGF